MPVPPDPSIPDKLYFRIGEVSRIVGVPQSVLRFWETEFSGIRPKRTEAGQRLYRKNDILLIFKIKDLLYDQKFTIKGARNFLKTKSDSAPGKFSESDLIRYIRSELDQIKNLLE